ncbi:DUF4132 domain-containing protein [Stappia indica]|uniref:DUF4132 domain-containing protein n=1 Tax=Stappia indica TaxID=538381 RepID=UPI00082E326B|nr:DUF4132 domain-containing protein [Stappia indica]
MDLIGKIFGKRKRDEASGAASSARPGVAEAIGAFIGADLRAITRHHTELCDRAIAYVFSGNDDAVLGEIGSKCVQHHDPELTRKRCDFLLTQAGLAPDVTARHLLVLVTARSTRHNPLDPNRLPWAVLVEAFNQIARQFASTSQQAPLIVTQDGLTFDTAEEIARVLGGDRRDVIAALLTANNNSSPDFGALATSSRAHKSAPYIDQLAVETIFREHPGLVIGVAETQDEHEWHGLRLLLLHWRLLDNTDYLTFFMNRSAPRRKPRNAPHRDDAGISFLKSAPLKLVERLMIEALPGAEVKLRVHFANWLIGTGSSTALDALAAHLEQEKSGEVRHVIEAALTGRSMAGGAGEGDDDTGYMALDGERVELPPLKDFETCEKPTFGPADRDELLRLVELENQRRQAEYEERERKGWAASAPNAVTAEGVDSLIAFLNAFEAGGSRQRLTGEAWYHASPLPRMLDSGSLKGWWLSCLRRFPERERLELGHLAAYRAFTDPRTGRSTRGCGATVLEEYLASPRADLRQLEKVGLEIGEYLHGGGSRKAVRGDMLAKMIGDGQWISADPDDFAPEAAAPFVASNLHVLDEAFAVSAKTWKLSRRAAFRWLDLLPKTPRRLVAPLLAIATGTRKENRADARRLLSDLPGLDDQLIAMLGDKRQETRTEAARWLADRRAAQAEPALRKQLKREKSDGPRAAMLTALRRIGADISEYAGPAALLAEARAGLKTANLAKLDWLPLAGLGRVSYRSGEPVPEDVVTWWLHLACKLKQPGGNGLLTLYLDQLAEADAEALSMKIFDSWIDFDTETKVEEYWLNPQVLLDRRTVYLNNGAEVKGVLALARAVPPVHAVKRVRWFLKNHGQRSHQSAALLELLAAKADPVSLQLVLSAAQRLKQKSVQKLAREFVARIADDNDWSIDELADRTVPTAGLDEEGRLDLPVGEDAKIYAARLDENLKLALFNPSGKAVKSLPAGDDEATKEAKKVFTAAKKEIAQAVELQSDRLYGAMCSGRSWPVEDWTRDFRGHPLMRKLVERLVWLGFDEDERLLAVFRPTPEGECIDLDDESVDLGTLNKVRLAHAALVGTDVADGWRAHLKDFEIVSPFSQFDRTFIPLPADLAEATQISDRHGWVTTTFAVRSLAKKQGYDRGEVVDSGHFDHYLRRFDNCGLIGVVGFSGNCVPEEDMTAVIHSLHFARNRNGRPGPVVQLKHVPPALLSECWHDYHSIAAKGAFDPEWEKRSPW